MQNKTSSKNSLYISNPTIAREWHPAKNGSLTPKDITAYSSRKVWWLCPNGHVWSATVSERIHGRSCPNCSKKEQPEEQPEQSISQGFNPDLAKEWHPTRNKSLRVWWLCPKGHEWSATVNERLLGNDCPYCSNKYELSDQSIIQETKPSPAKEIHPTKETSSKSPDLTPNAKKKVGSENCLQEANPNLANEWHPTKNENLTPQDVTINSNAQVWWKCSKGHEWKASVASRNKGQGCFYCSYMHKRKHS